MLSRRPRTPEEQRKADRARARRAALKALRKARLAAGETGVKLSDWEGEFLSSVETRVEKYGRAFRDPEKGAARASLSMLQQVKLKEIGAKARGGKSARRFKQPNRD
ncbi:MAG TPA: hypothetical protein VMH86_05490 [Rhizomicrobium sp.]|nr:hypothetical protein [Rhizomicrobium sp.]